MHLFNLREPVSSLTHAAWFLAALPATALLLRRSRHDRLRQLGLLVYGLSLALCAASSAAFHGLRLSDRSVTLLSHVDHIGIGVFIAGTYTPIALTLLQGRWRWGTLTLVWLAAALSAAVRLSLGAQSPWFSTTLYLAMGWGSILCYAELARALSQRDLTPIVVGGLLYSGGAFCHVARWPVILPGVLEGHELFHLFVMAGSLAHYRFVLQVIASRHVPKSEPIPPSGVPGRPSGPPRPVGTPGTAAARSRFDDPHAVQGPPRRWWSTLSARFSPSARRSA